MFSLSLNQFKRGSLWLAMMAVSGSVWAQQTEAEPSIERIEVYADSYRTTGTKSALTPLQAPMSYEVYDSELLQLRAVDSVNEALRYVPGVTPESRGTVTIFDQYSIRGFQSYRNYYDGLQLPYNNLWNLAAQVDAYASERIEVLKGPTSVLYGSAPPGGMVNQVAKLPLSTEQTSLRLRAGTQSLAEIGIDHNGISDIADYRVVALARQRDGQMQTTEEERYLLAPSATFQLAERTSLNLNLYYQRDPRAIPSTPLPAEGTVLNADWGRLDSDAYAGDGNWNNVDRSIGMVGYKFNHQFANGLTFLQNFRYTDGELLQRNSYHFAPAGRTLTRAAYRTDESMNGYTVDNQLAFELSHGEVTHAVLVGVDYQTLNSDVRYRDTFGANTPTIDLAAPDHHQFDIAALEASFAYDQLNDIEQTQVGYYLQDEISVANWVLLANLRHDQYESTDKQQAAGAETITDIDQSETSVRLAVIYNFENGIRPYVNYATSYEPTSGVDTNTGAAFKPTTAEQFEVGLKYAGERVQITSAYFDITQENVVVNTPDFMQYTQTGEVTSTGFELSLAGQVSEDLELLATYNHQDVEVSDNPLNPNLVGKTPVWVADKQASLWATYYLNDRFDVSAGIRFVGESALDAENTATVPSYTLGDIAMTYRINPTMRIGLSVNNVTNERYVGACSDATNCWMGMERTAELTLNLDL
ncbi:TonB-dependent siderophore receptor [Idiomarina xiamenensis]|uniref:TonB-dependent siderophore receptor n=1 Tax=Idiomarina xiamenensis 10-D-4 TaxID=740709 RepID=K2JZF4_9GAMM|nr:TonB-dependent siderophore receptor [Idiomarina xiamenensis]EKE79967.1 TonB-dependent siderophore receptor [Idiomarina xiamenensis 10-D-4]